MQSLRVGLFAALILLIHRQHVEFTAAQRQDPARALTLEHAAPWFPGAAALQPAEDFPGAQDVLDAQAHRLGMILQTAPEGDEAVGFSGPSNVLLACDGEGRIIGVEVLSSRDTPEHVAQIRQSARFLQGLNGLPLRAAAAHPRVDAVSGATLTSLAILEAIQRRVGVPVRSLKFPDDLRWDEVQELFPTAVQMERDPLDPSATFVRNAAGQRIGWLLRTSPAADKLVGYQGPAETLLAFDAEGKLIRLTLRKSFDNEPYVGYVREDAYFTELFLGKTLKELAGWKEHGAGIEGVSGATMTSQAVAAGIIEAAASRRRREQLAAAERPAAVWGMKEVASIMVIGLGTLVGLTHLRGTWFGRVLLPLLVIGYLGFTRGELLSQAQWVGWAQAGVPRGAAGLVVLTIAAFVLPIATKRNVYCSHLCAHGAAQQLLLRLRGRGTHPPLPARGGLVLLPAVLLVICLVVALTHAPLSLVDLEPFDAYVVTVAGAATLTIAVVSLVISYFVPMAYCRYGCPTGAVLQYLRRHARSDRLTWRDAFAAGCVVAAALWNWHSGNSMRLRGPGETDTIPATRSVSENPLRQPDASVRTP